MALSGKGSYVQLNKKNLTSTKATLRSSEVES